MDKLSLVIPVHNEERNLKILYDEVLKVLHPLKLDYEFVFVDDGSLDASYSVLKSLAEKDSNVKIVKLMSNYGQSSAIAAGVEHSEGDVIVTMDSDLQHDPKDIPKMLEQLKKGYQVVCGWRVGRNSSDSFFSKSIPSRISNWLINKWTGLNLKDSTGGMRAFEKRVTDNVQIYGEMHRYLPILAAWKGFKVTEVPINIRKRKFGKTKYNFKRLSRGFFDLVTVKFLMSYSTRPIQMFGGVGVILFLIGILTGIYLLIEKFAYHVHIMQAHQPLLLLVILLIILGFNFISFGLIADMISFDAITSKKRTVYIVDKVIQKKLK